MRSISNPTKGGRSCAHQPITGEPYFPRLEYRAQIRQCRSSCCHIACHRGMLNRAESMRIHHAPLQTDIGGCGKRVIEVVSCFGRRGTRGQFRRYCVILDHIAAVVQVLGLLEECQEAHNQVQGLRNLTPASQQHLHPKRPQVVIRSTVVVIYHDKQSRRTDGRTSHCGS